jgi:BRCT domain type II-containing protein
MVIEKQNTELKILPAGVYKLIVVGVDVRKAKDLNKEYLLWELADVFTGASCHIITSSIWTSKNNLNNLLVAIGISESETKIETDALVGKKFIAKLGIEKKPNGTLINKISIPTPAEYKQFVAERKKAASSTTKASSTSAKASAKEKEKENVKEDFPDDIDDIDDFPED